MPMPKCLKCGRTQCQIPDTVHDANTPQSIPGFEQCPKPVDFNEVLKVSMQGVKVVKSPKHKPNAALKRAAKGKTYKQVNAPKAGPGTVIGGGDVRLTTEERVNRIKEAGGNPCKVYVQGELPKGGPLMPYQGLAADDFHDAATGGDA